MPALALAIANRNRINHNKDIIDTLMALKMKKKQKKSNKKLFAFKIRHKNS